MKLTPQKIAALYRALRMLPPFDRYKMPRDVDINFKVNRSAFLMGSYNVGCDGHELAVSAKLNKTLMDVIETMLHEMVHMALERKGCSDHSEHDCEWNALAAEVCDTLGFKFPTF